MTSILVSIPITIETLVIWHAIVLIMTSLWWGHDFSLFHRAWTLYPGLNISTHSLFRTGWPCLLFKTACSLDMAPSRKWSSSGDKLSLWWRHYERDGVSNHQRLDCLLNRLFRRGSKKTSNLRVTGLCEGNSSVAGEFPAQRASNAENVSIWWRYHDDDGPTMQRPTFSQTAEYCGRRQLPVLHFRPKRTSMLVPIFAKIRGIFSDRGAYSRNQEKG